MRDDAHLPQAFSSQLCMSVCHAPILFYYVILLNGPLGTDVITEKHAPEESRPVCAWSYVNVKHVPTRVSWFIGGTANCLWCLLMNVPH